MADTHAKPVRYVDVQRENIFAQRQTLFIWEQEQVDMISMQKSVESWKPGH